MGGFIYFVPVGLSQLVKDQRLDVEQLKANGLHEVLADVVDVPNDCIATEVTAGPDGQPGTVLFPISPGAGFPKVPGYVPESQQWHKSPKYWIGFDGEPPRPEHLARKSIVLGYLVPDGHGRSWHIPLIRGLDRPYGALPCDYQFGDDFLPSEVLRKQYRSLWNDSARMWDAYDESKGVADVFSAQFAARCLAVNHRVGPEELNLLAELGLTVFDRTTVKGFTGCAIDAPAVCEFIEQKKTTPSLPVPDGTTSLHGTRDDTNTGDQRAANCA